MPAALMVLLRVLALVAASGSSVAGPASAFRHAVVLGLCSRAEPTRPPFRVAYVARSCGPSMPTAAAVAPTRDQHICVRNACRCRYAERRHRRAPEQLRRAPRPGTTAQPPLSVVPGLPHSTLHARAVASQVTEELRAFHFALRSFKDCVPLSGWFRETQHHSFIRPQASVRCVGLLVLPPAGARDRRGHRGRPDVRLPP
jgi:hypothetical protein